MMQVVLHHFPAAQVEYRYKCRTPNINLAAYLDEIRQEIHALCQLRFTEQELEYLRGLRFIKSDFVDFLGLFHMPEKCIKVSPGAVPGEIDIRSEEHTSELQSLMRISYAVFCLQKTNTEQTTTNI